MTTPESQGKNNPIAKRLRILRRAAGYKHSKAYAEFLGINPKRYNNMENGFPLSRQVEEIIVSKVPGASADWIKRGSEAALTLAMLQRLRDAEAQLDQKTPRKRSGAAG